MPWSSAPLLVAIFNRYLEGGVVPSWKEEVAFLPALGLQINLFALGARTPKDILSEHFLIRRLEFSTTKFEFFKRRDVPTTGEKCTGTVVQAFDRSARK